LSKKLSDYAFHPPSGSNVPGKEEANPYINFSPDELRQLVKIEQDRERLDKIKSALKQWERQYQYPSYPWRVAAVLRVIAKRIAEIVGPAQNIPYYQDAEVPEGYEGILESLHGLYDNYDYPRENLQRPGERPLKDQPFFIGDFSAPNDPVFDAVKPRGDGPDPEGMECPFPPTGGDIDRIPDMI